MLPCRPRVSARVGHFLCIGVSAENAGAVKALSEQYADVDCSVGVHPLDLAPGETPALEWLLRELAHPHVVAIGETGLDYHYEPEAAELQQASFRLHLEASRQTGKPVIVHTRAARADTLALLREASLPQAGCCTASPKTGTWPRLRWTWVITFRCPAS
jgi:TatD DNase family protein